MNIGEFIMGMKEKGPTAGKIVNISLPQYPGESTLYEIITFEYERDFIPIEEAKYFNETAWIKINEQWNIIINARKQIENILNGI